MIWDEKMKKILAGLSVLLLTCIFVSPVSASGKDWNIVIEDGVEILYNVKTGEKIRESFELNEKNELQLVPIEKVKESLNNSVSFDETPIQSNESIVNTREVPSTYWTKSFQKSSEERVNGSPIRMSNDQYDSGSISVDFDLSYSMSISSGIGVDTPFKKAIIKASSSSSLAISISQSITHTLNKLTGRGFLAFTPYLQKVTGTGYKRTYSQTGYLLKTESYATTALIPIKFNNGPFGMWHIVYY